jgi:CubicO group peptidase (beta-lactamase class C family)
MTLTDIGANPLFLSARWLADVAGQLGPPDSAAGSTVAFRMEVTDPPPTVLTGVDIRVDLASGRLGVASASGPRPGLLIRGPYAAARELLLGSAEQRVRIFERGDIEAIGNFSLLFFIDAALQRDQSQCVATLKAHTAADPRFLLCRSAPAAVEPASDVPYPEGDESVECARVALPLTLRALEYEVGTSTPGAQIYVSQAGRPVADAGLGFARPGVSMTRRSMPLWYCCGKPLLSVALGKLWEEGLYDFHLPVASYLPEFGSAGKAAITSAELLTHTGPVPTGIDPLHGVVAGPDVERHRRAFALAVADDAGRTHRINYSQWWAWFVLAQLVPAIDGRDYVSYVEQEILRPCGIEATRIHLSPSDFADFGSRLPMIYVSNLGDTPQPTHWWSTEAAATRCIPGVNTRGPLRDLGKLFEMLLSGGTGPAGRVISPTTVSALTARHRTGLYDRYGNADWALGFRLECRHISREYTSFGSHTSPRSYGHDGLWTAVVFADPDAELVVAIHLNGKVEHNRHRKRILCLADAVYQDLRLS